MRIFKRNIQVSPCAVVFDVFRVRLRVDSYYKIIGIIDTFLESKIQYAWIAPYYKAFAFLSLYLAGNI